MVVAQTCQTMIAGSSSSRECRGQTCLMRRSRDDLRNDHLGMLRRRSIRLYRQQGEQCGTRPTKFPITGGIRHIRRTSASSVVALLTASVCGANEDLSDAGMGSNRVYWLRSSREGTLRIRQQVPQGEPRLAEVLESCIQW